MQQEPSGPQRPQRPHPHYQQPPVVSLHPEPSPWRGSGSRHSLDFVDNRDKWLPPRPASSMSYQRQGSAMSVEDDASTTTSGSYTVNPEELRIEGYIGADVIV